MRPILPALVLFALLANPLLAACDGQDLRATLTAAEQADLDARLAGLPYPEGNHWRATRGDEVLHLVGTMHLDDPRLDGPAARLAPVVETAGLLLLEMDATEREALNAALQTRTDILLLPDETLPELLPEEDWNRLAEAMRQRGMPPFMGARMRPWYLSVMLAIPACLTDQLTDANGLDSRLEAAAAAAGVPTASLEPFETGFEAFSTMPFASQMLMIRSALTTPEDGEDLFETMLSAYFDEAHGTSQAVLEVLSPRLAPLTEAETEEVFDLLDDALMTRRNHAWIPVLTDALDRTDRHVVAAFGAAHLAGEDGVLKLLEEAGFTLERLPF